MASSKIALYAMASAVLVGVGIVFAIRPAEPSMWIGAVIVGAAAIASLISFVSSRNNMKRTFDGRADLTDEDIYRQFFADSDIPKALVVELWHEAAKVFGVRSGKLRPTDRFGHELGRYSITSEKLDALAAIAGNRAKAKNAKLDLLQVETLGAYVHKVAAIGK